MMPINMNKIQEIINLDDEQLHWVWGVYEQERLHNSHDAQFINVVRQGWPENENGMFHLTQMLGRYGVSRSFKDLKEDYRLEDIKRTIKIFNDYYSVEIANTLEDPANLAAEISTILSTTVEALRVIWRKNLISAASKVFWFYKPEKT